MAIESNSSAPTGYSERDPTALAHATYDVLVATYGPHIVRSLDESEIEGMIEGEPMQPGEALVITGMAALQVELGVPIREIGKA